jgi:hypothetical protein
MNTTKTAPGDGLVLDALRDSPQVRAALSERQTQIVADRKLLAARLAEVEAGVPARRYVALVKRHNEALEAARAAHAAFEEASHKVALLQGERLAASFAISGERDEILTKLRSTADNDAIDAFTREMRDAMQNARKMVDSRELSVTNKITGRSGVKIVTNGPAVAERLLAINEAIQSAEDFRLLPDQSAVPARLAALRAALPPPVSSVAMEV